jgi:hypothetical protein
LAQVLPTAGSPNATAARGPQRGNGRAAAVVAACYLLAAVAVTWHLWADPASRTVAGNPNDADFFAWCLRYSATAVSHGRLPSLVTAAMNAPQGINLMWNTSILLPGIVLSPVTLLLGPQTALTVLMTAGFAGSAYSLFWVLRRWDVSTGAAALAGAVYGFSPALLQASTGHYNLQFAVLPPLIIHWGLLLCVRSRTPVRDGIILGLLITAQLFTGEELLLLSGTAGLLLVVVLAVSRPRAVLARLGAALDGLAVAAAVTVVLSGYPLWTQFRGPLAQHGSAFTPDFFKNDVTGFVTPSSYLLFHTSASAAAAASYQGGAPEYLAYLGWPLIIVLAAAAIAFWRHAAVRATAVTAAVLVLLSLGAHPLVSGIADTRLTLPWHWFEGLPLIGTALPDRMSIMADGAAAALLAFALDAARAALARAGPGAPRAAAAALTPAGTGVPGAAAAAPGLTGTGVPGAAAAAPGLAGSGAPDAASGVSGIAGSGAADPGVVRPGSRGWATALLTAVAVLACLPLIPLPLRSASASGVPAGWSAAFSALRLPAAARVLVVPVPTPTLTDALRWQADTGVPGSLAGGYFVGPAWNGQAYVGGNGVTATARYLDGLWSGVPAGPVPAASQVKADLAGWRLSAVVAVTSPGSALGHYLRGVFGPPAIRTGGVLAWRL